VICCQIAPKNLGLHQAYTKINHKILDEIAKKLQIKKKSWMKSPNCG